MPTFAEGTIEINVPTEKIRELVSSPLEGLELDGSIEEGNFKVEEYGIEGIYRSTDIGDGAHHFHVTITKKPFFITIGKIESKLRELLPEPKKK